MILRPYQQKAIEDIRAIYSTGIKRVMYVLPCSGGKTAVFARICFFLKEKNKKALILVHRKQLLDQGSNMLSRMGIPHGRAIAGKVTQSDIMIGSVQTVSRKLHKMQEPHIIVCDEAHLSTSASYQKIFKHWSSAYVLGVTASPKILSNKGFENQYDYLVNGPSLAELIDEGYISPYTAYGPAYDIDTSQLSIKGGDYDIEQSEDLMSSTKIIGDAVAHYRKYADKQPAIAFCVSIKHAQIVAEQFRNAGYSACHIDGSMNDVQRKEILDGLTTGKYNIVTSCNLVSEGLDIPVLTASILLRPTKSLALAIQQTGRALRPVYASSYDLSTKEGRLQAIANSTKPFAVILDHAGVLLEHGLPDEPREWSLKGESRRRSNDAIKTVNLRRCPECLAIHKILPDCPRCNHHYVVQERKPDVKDGELQQLTKENIKQIKKKLRQEVGMAKTDEDLRRIAKERGYKSGWVYHIKRIRERRRKDVTDNR